MVDTDKIRGLMAENRLTGKDMAEALNMSANTFSAKMKAKVFNTNEIEIMISLLHIENPIPIFFAKNVTHEETTSQPEEGEPGEAKVV